MQVEEWVERYREAWERADPDAAAALFAETATYRSHPVQEPHVGRERIRAYWRDVTAPQSDVRVRVGRAFVDGSRVAVEFWTTMRVAGEGELTLPGCLLLHFGPDGLCESLREYWHAEPGRREPTPDWGT